MPKSAGQTANWVAGNISKMSQVREVTVLGPNTIQISRKKHDSFVAGIISVPIVIAKGLGPTLL
jgi:hypothetical protein